MRESGAQSRSSLRCWKRDFSDDVWIRQTENSFNLIVSHTFGDAYEVFVVLRTLTKMVENYSIWNRTEIGMTHPMYSMLEKIKVFLISNPIAMMSLAFSFVNRSASSTSRFFQNDFSSSVIWITRGTSNASCNHLEKLHHQSGWEKNLKKNSTYFVTTKGTRWPKCMDSDDGPLPV